MSHHYSEARAASGLSREKLSNLAKQAGINISAASVKKLEDEGEKAIGTRGVSVEAAGYISYLLGVGDFDPTNWASVEKGAPVLVLGEKGSWKFISADETSVTVFGQNFRSFDISRVRLIAPTATPPVESAGLFETRTRGSGGVYAQEVLSYVSAHADQPHGIGAIAVALGRDNALISRTVAGLVKAGKLTKISRGVVGLAGGAAPALAVSPPEAPSTAESTTSTVPSF